MPGRRGERPRVKATRKEGGRSPLRPGSGRRHTAQPTREAMTDDATAEDTLQHGFVVGLCQERSGARRATVGATVGATVSQ